LHSARRLSQLPRTTHDRSLKAPLLYCALTNNATRD
jgi:hypothetical protein